MKTDWTAALVGVASVIAVTVMVVMGHEGAAMRIGGGMAIVGVVYFLARS